MNQNKQVDAEKKLIRELLLNLQSDKNSIQEQELLFETLQTSNKHIGPIAFNQMHAIHFAASVGKTHLLQRLLEAGVDPDVTDAVLNSILLEIGRTPLHFATMKADKEIFLVLLGARVNINAQTIGGDTPLMKALQYSQFEMAKWMLETFEDKIQLFHQNRAGLTAQQIAEASIDASQHQIDPTKPFWENFKTFASSLNQEL